MDTPDTPESLVGEDVEAPEAQPALVIVDDDLHAWARGWPKYQKTALVSAFQMEVLFAVDTPEGRMTGQPGDYLCGPGAGGEYWPVRQDIFQSTYERVE
jgi:hypothetical protein